MMEAFRERKRGRGERVGKWKWIWILDDVARSSYVVM